MPVSAANMSVTIFLVIMQVGVPVEYFLQCIMHVIVSFVFMQVTVSVIAMHLIVSINSFIFHFVSNWHPLLIKLNENHLL